MCVRFGSFTYNEKEYFQHEGLAMGSPLSAVLANLYMEMLEADKLLRLVPKSTTWYRYVDDIVIITHRNTNLQTLLLKLNQVNDSIQFTIEEEVDGHLPYLDMELIRDGNIIKFKVHRKPTNKDDFIHYASAHSKNTKTGVVIGFFLRAYRICSNQYLKEEIDHITNTFTKLGYPRGLLIKLKDKANAILQRRDDGNKQDEWLAVPNYDFVPNIANFLKHTKFKIAAAASKTIKQILSKPPKHGINQRSIVYSIPCNGCEKNYYGETGRGLNQRLREHKADLRFHRTNNALVVHGIEEGHLPNFEQAAAILSSLTKPKRKFWEAVYIHSNKESLNKRAGDFTLAEGTTLIATNLLHSKPNAVTSRATDQSQVTTEPPQRGNSMTSITPDQPQRAESLPASENQSQLATVHIRKMTSMTTDQSQRTVSLSTLENQSQQRNNVTSDANSLIP